MHPEKDELLLQSDHGAFFLVFSGTDTIASF
jgi:hypothetical protein